MERTRLTLFALALIMPILLMVGLVTAVSPPTARAAPQITVTTLGNSGAGSLRQAIADVDPGGTIHFNVSGTIVLASELVIGKDLTIQGNIPITISGNNTTRVFNVTAGHVTFDSLTIISGTVQMTTDCPPLSGRCGGAIMIRNSNVVVTVTNSTIMGNSAQFGGGIYTNGFLTIVNSTIEKNIADWGGGVYAHIPSNKMIVHRSTFYSNTANSVGGGIYLVGKLTVDNSTFSSNAAGWNGGGIGNSSLSVVEVSNSTITSNTADANNNGTGGGGGISAFGVTVITITNTIISHNYDLGGEAPDCFVDNQIDNGGIYSQGYNLIGDTTGCDLETQSTDLLNEDPLLMDLADNGGSTWTYLLQAGSPAINHIPVGMSGCQVGQTDQRGVIRPQGIRCDVGAVEIEMDTAVYSLTVALAGQGSGAVSSDPEGVSCGEVCVLPDLVGGSVVTLTAVGETGSIFTGWSGDVITTTNPLLLTMDSHKTITATFALDETGFAIYLPLVLR